MRPTHAAGVTGEVLVGAAHVKERYDGLWLTQQASARDAGWHRTGDVGHLDADGRLWIEGRLAHVLVTADGVLTPVGLEQRAQARRRAWCPRRSSASGRAARSRWSSCVEPEVFSHGPVVAEPDLAAAVRAALAGTDVAAVLVVEQLPTDVRHNSKIDRTRVAAWAERVLAGERARL